MQSTLPPTEENFLEIAKQALWLKDYKTLREICTILFQLQPSPSSAVLVQLVGIADKSAQGDLMREALGLIKVASLDRPWMLQTLIDVGGFYGMYDLQKQARAKLKAVESFG